MRILGEIPHPRLKITVFKTDTRYSLKLEDGFLEQTYKFREDENVTGFEDIRRLADDRFLQQVSELFTLMGRNHLSTLDRHLPEQPGEFEDII